MFVCLGLLFVDVVVVIEPGLGLPWIIHTLLRFPYLSLALIFGIITAVITLVGNRFLHLLGWYTGMMLR